MEKYNTKIINILEYKKKKQDLKIEKTEDFIIERKELLQLLKAVVRSK